MATAANLSPGSPAARCTKSDRQSGGMKKRAGPRRASTAGTLYARVFHASLMYRPTMPSSPPRVGVHVSRQWGTNPVHVLL